MNEFGFMRFAVASVSSQLLNCSTNAEKIISLTRAADNQNTNLLLFQELTITGATCEDMFFSQELLQNARAALLQIVEASKNFSVIVSVGCPLIVDNLLYSTQVIIYAGKILAVIPLHQSLYPFRQYAGNEKNVQYLFDADYEIRFGNFPIHYNVTAGAIKQHFSFRFADIDELRYNACNKSYDADVILVPTAIPNFVNDCFQESVKSFSRRQNSIVLFANASTGESSGENIFLGECGIFEDGKMLAFENIFSAANKTHDVCPTTRSIDLTVSPFAISDADVQLVQNLSRNEKKSRLEFSTILQNTITHNELPIHINCNKLNTDLIYTVKANPYIPDFDTAGDEKKFFIDVLDYTAAALVRRLSAIGTDKTVLGISGGIDSTFALLVCARAMQFLRKPNDNIYAITMPCFGTTSRTKNNALTLAKNLLCRTEIIDIAKTVRSHFKDIAQNFNEHNTTFENAQARERTQVLMDKANQCGGIVVSASDLSEIALGWSTFAGDHISMYNVAASLPKTILRHAIKIFVTEAALFKSTNEKIFAKTLNDILLTPVSPELLPADSDGKISQKTESILGEYNLHDFFIFHFVRNKFTKNKILFLAEKAFAGVYSRSEIEKALSVFFKRFFTNQFKRSCSPEGVSVLPLSLSPRRNWNMPADLHCTFLENFFE